MTCKEKYENDHNQVLPAGRCPSQFGYLDDPLECTDPNGSMSCSQWWAREIPEKRRGRKEVAKSSEPAILDSGDRTRFESGAVRDMREGKGRMDLLPWAAIMEVSKHCENGAKKYGEHNVDKGIPTSSLCDSAARHLAKYLDGWTDESHLLAAAWNLLWALQMHIKHPEVVDTPWRQENTADTPKE